MIERKPGRWKSVNCRWCKGNKAHPACEGKGCEGCDETGDCPKCEGTGWQKVWD